MGDTSAGPFREINWRKVDEYRARGLSWMLLCWSAVSRVIGWTFPATCYYADLMRVRTSAVFTLFEQRTSAPAPVASPTLLGIPRGLLLLHLLLNNWG